MKVFAVFLFFLFLIGLIGCGGDRFGDDPLTDTTYTDGNHSKIPSYGSGGQGPVGEIKAESNPTSTSDSTSTSAATTGAATATTGAATASGASTADANNTTVINININGQPVTVITDGKPIATQPVDGGKVVQPEKPADKPADLPADIRNFQVALGTGSVKKIGDTFTGIVAISGAPALKDFYIGWKLNDKGKPVLGDGISTDPLNGWKVESVEACPGFSLVSEPEFPKDQLYGFSQGQLYIHLKEDQPGPDFNGDKWRSAFRVKAVILKSRFSDNGLAPGNFLFFSLPDVSNLVTTSYQNFQYSFIKEAGPGTVTVGK